MKIKYKFALGFLVIFILSVIAFNIIIDRVFQSHINGIIKEDMTQIYKNSYKHIQYYFNLRGLTPEENILINKSPEIALNISEQNNCFVALYNVNGIYKYSYPNEISEFLKNKDKESTLINNAKENKSSINIYIEEGKVVSSCSYAIYIEDKLIGIIKFAKDYTDIYSKIKGFVDILSIISFIAFLLILIFSYMVSNNLVLPLPKLKEAFRQVAMGNYDAKVDIRGSDELSDLSKSFIAMKNRIKEQMDIINEEKEKVLLLEKTRTEFFNNVTHELKTPLTTISGYAQIIGEENFNDKIFQTMALDRIKSESQRMHEMVVSLIEISKYNTEVEERDFNEINIKKLLDNILKDLSIRASKYNLTIQCKIQPVKFKARRGRLTTIFTNIIDNAIKYSSANSEIIIKAYEKNNIFVFEIENYCEYISEDKLSKFFEPFYRADVVKSRELGSNGLGLFICKSMVEEQKGTIDIKYEDNKFKVIIKLSTDN